MGELQQSDYRIRKLIGVLGLALPFLLPIAAEGSLLASISHNYYLPLPSLVFIIILSTMALFLISYKGYRIDGTGKKEYISDDWITNIGGLAALIVVIVPTSCAGSANDIIKALCDNESYPLLGHNDTLRNIIHLISAGVFLLAMGWMSAFKFTRGCEPGSKKYKFFKRCGYAVWGSIGILVIYFALLEFLPNFKGFPYMVYLMETVAIVPFGISWLAKGKTMTYLKNFVTKMQRTN